MSPTEYRTQMKIERAKDLMERGEYSVAELSDVLGFNDPSYFWRVFKKVTGMNPTDYQKLIVFKR
jgi:two-component system response regulator YesN